MGVLLLMVVVVVHCCFKIHERDTRAVDELKPEDWIRIGC